MDWFEKEAAFADRWLAGKIDTNEWRIWKYIPARMQAFVDGVGIDSDGYWIWLDEDHVAYDGGEDCRTIHEYTIADLKAAIKTIRRRT